MRRCRVLVSEPILSLLTQGSQSVELGEERREACICPISSAFLSPCNRCLSSTYWFPCLFAHRRSILCGRGGCGQTHKYSVLVQDLPGVSFPRYNPVAVAEQAYALMNTCWRAEHL